LREKNRRVIKIFQVVLADRYSLLAEFFFEMGVDQLFVETMRK